MPITYEAIQEDDYIRIVTSGVLKTLSELIEYGTFMYEQAMATGMPRILLDEENLEDAADAKTIYEWCEHEVVAKTATAGIRIAGVCSSDNYECNKLYETMLQNRSYVFKVFDSEKEALAWLKSTNMPEKARPLPFAYCFDEYEDYLKVTVRGGPSSLQDMLSYVSMMVEKTRISGINRVFVDETRATIKLDLHKSVATNEILNQEFMEEQDIRVAVTCAPHSRPMYEFFENQLQSCPFTLRVFDDEAAGLAWLLAE